MSFSDNPLAVFRAVLLAAVGLPLAAAVVTALAGRAGAGAARRAAVVFAGAHLGLAGLLAAGTTGQILARAEQTAAGFAHFSPVAVPGDAAGDGGGEAGETSWRLMAVAPARPGLPPPEVQFYLGLDGLNVWLVVLTSLLTLVAVLATGDDAHRGGAYFAWLFVLQLGVTGAFLSFDVVLFYVFFELTLIPAFFLIGGWGVGGGRREAARKYFLYNLLGGLVTLVGAVGVVLTNPTPVLSGASDVMRGGTLQAQPAYLPGALPLARQDAAAAEGPITFSIPRLMRNVSFWAEYRKARADRAAAAARTAERVADEAKRKAAADPAARPAADRAVQAAERAVYDRDHLAAEVATGFRVQTWLFFAVIAGFLVKSAVVPFHTWLPAAYTEAPAPVAMVLAGVVSKLGAFGMLRLAVPLCPDAAFVYGLPVVGFFGAVGIVYAALCAVTCHDAKRLVAYSSVSHLGFLVLGLFALNREGVTGAALHLVNHGLSTGATFALLGFLYDRYRTTDMTRYGGLLGRFPAFALLMFTVCLAGIGLPGLNNFVGEMLMMAGLFEKTHTGGIGYGLAATAAVGVFLSAWYTLTMLRRLFFGPAKEPEPVAGVAPRDVTGREALAFGLPAVLCVVLGVYPQPVIDVLAAGAEPVVQVTNAARLRAGYSPADLPPPAAPKPGRRPAPLPAGELHP